jgi:hypothetical protein
MTVLQTVVDPSHTMVEKVHNDIYDPIAPIIA